MEILLLFGVSAFCLGLGAALGIGVCRLIWKCRRRIR